MSNDTKYKKRLVVLSGAGISAESGLKTFRDADGLWEGYDVTEVATPGAWKRNPKLVLNFYNMRRRDVAAANPNAAHFAIAALEKDFEVTVITQNIDDLHERGGSANVIHLHGQIFKMRGDNDEDSLFDINDDMTEGSRAPDGTLLRPAIVWFEEAVPMIGAAVPIVKRADIILVIGTSMLVYPAASLIHFVRSGIPKFIIDKKVPSISGITNLTAIEMPATLGMVELLKHLEPLK